MAKHWPDEWTITTLTEEQRKPHPAPKKEYDSDKYPPMIIFPRIRESNG